MGKAQQEIAQALLQAWQAGTAWHDDGVLAQLPDAASGYEIQQQLHQLFHAAGRRAIGWKIGLTSQAALDLFGASEPMVGVIYEDSLLQSGAQLPPARTISPRIEGEMLLQIGHVPPTDADDAALRASLASVSMAFEIADSRIAGWPRAIGAAVADNACCGWLVRSAQSADPQDVDFTATQMAIARNDEQVTAGRADAYLGNILHVYRWFIENSARNQRAIAPGDIILTGAMGPAPEMMPGGKYHLNSPQLGQVALHYGMAA